ncbi:MAG TPA: amidohydrolase family protein, partial [Acidimicrobiales bacterium]|nr:amidohydrolase family protein [Acidimicrobiales bacterium]
LPRESTPEERLIMSLADEGTERMRRKFGMSRRNFVRTAAAYGVGIAAINQVRDLTWGHYALGHTETTKACDLQYDDPQFLDKPEFQLGNLPGEFIFDIQSHHVESDGTWRVTNPIMEGFFAGVWSQAGPLGGVPGTRKDGSVRGFGAGELDPIENLSRFHYLKELYLDSATTMCVLSAVPSDPDNQPLPLERAALTVRTVNDLAQSRRCVMHAFVMPNRGSVGTTSSSLGRPPVFQQAEFDAMEANAQKYGDIIVGWKTYPAWGDVPYASGWYFDDDLGLAFCQKVLDVHEMYPHVPPVIATHKGFALPAFDQRAASPRDIGPAARQYPGVRFIVYHSGYDSQAEGPYPGDDKVNSADRSVNAFVKSLRENRWDARRFVKPGLQHGNVVNVWAEIGSTWRSVMGDPNQAAHLLGKLITHVGPKRVAWGTDSLWFGSPQSEIAALRTFQMSDAAKQLYNLPYGLDGDVDDPTKNALSGSSYISPHPAVDGWPVDSKAHPERSIRNGIFGRNAAIAYEVDPDATFNKFSCDDVQKIRDAYLINQATPTASAPLSSNQLLGPRTARELINHRAAQPWSP